jgi:tRNA(Ile)-lysidine synthase
MASSPRLDSARIAESLQRFPARSSIKTWVLAYSGGVDSRVLLHLLSQLQLPLRAVYIDHGLQAVSKDWAEHCRQVCADLNIPFESISVDAVARDGESPEAAARAARYAALEKMVSDEDCLLTAQHRDDQAETFLLQLLRGAGAAGLSAMASHERFGRGWMLRPLLEISREDILECAHAQGLHWVDDPSNQDTRFDRNYLRADILPRLQQRWPATSRTLARAAQQQAENQRLLDVLAQQDIGECAQSALELGGLLALDEARQRNVLRYWFAQQHVRMPSQAILQQIIRQMLHAREDAEPCVQWDDVALHRYQNKLYLEQRCTHDVTQVLDWDGCNPLPLPSLRGELVLRESEAGLNSALRGKNLQVKFRCGGERIQPVGRTHTHELKKLMQEAGIPPWQRDRIPLLYCNNELIAVCGYWLAEKYAVNTGAGLTPVLLGKSGSL